MDPLRNPYTPNAGARPPSIVGRDDQLQTFDLLLHRMAAGRTEQSMIITGLRGVGKTVLLGRFRATAISQGWVAVDEEVAKHSDTDFRRSMAAWMRTALFALATRTVERSLSTGRRHPEVLLPQRGPGRQPDGGTRR